MSVRRTILDHPDLTIAFDDLSLDLADVLIDQRRYFALAREDLLTRLDHTVRAKRIGLPREAERRLRFLPRFEEWLVRPFRRERRVRLKLVDGLDRVERALGDVRQSFFEVFDRSHEYYLHQQK